MEASIAETTQAVKEEGVLIEMLSINNSSVWLMRKADLKSWHLIVDYRVLNRMTPNMTPVVAMYPEVMVSFAAGVK